MLALLLLPPSLSWRTLHPPSQLNAQARDHLDALALPAFDEAACNKIAVQSSKLIGLPARVGLSLARGSSP